MRTLNEHAFDQLAKSIGLPVFRTVLDTYYVTVPIHLKHLHIAVEQNDFPAMRREAHDLKGLWGTVGAEQVVALAIELDDACERQDRDAAALLLPQISEAARLAWSAIQARLEVQAAAAKVSAAA